jgi:glutathione S-transferase
MLQPQNRLAALLGFGGRLMSALVLRTLYHWPLDPFSRTLRLVLGEKKLSAELKDVSPWDGAGVLAGLTAFPTLPVLVEPSGLTLTGTRVILDYLEDTHKTPPLRPQTAIDRAEMMRIIDCVERLLAHEVGATLLAERIDQRVRRIGAPDTRRLRAGYDSMRLYLQHFDGLADRRAFIAGGSFSFADIVLAAHLSCFDYFGDLNLTAYPGLETWYLRMKSRPAFRPLLTDSLPGAPPHAHYSSLDA